MLSSPAPDANILITDFGLSAILPKNGRLFRAVGTPAYVGMELFMEYFESFWGGVEGSRREILTSVAFSAPEVIETTLTFVGYSKEVDMWGLGVILYALLCGFLPFFGDTTEDIYDGICNCSYSYITPYWDNISDNGLDLFQFVN